MHELVNSELLESSDGLVHSGYAPVHMRTCACAREWIVRFSTSYFFQMLF